MPLELPMYLIAGEKPISVEETPDGGLRLLGWDFERGEMARNVDWNEVASHLQPGVQVRRNAPIADGGDTFRVSKEEFDRRVEELRGGRREGGRPRTVGPPEPLTARRASGVVEVGTSLGFTKSIMDEAPPCCEESEEPEEQQKLRRAARDAYGDDSPTR